MPQFIIHWINQITMYRLMLIYLLVLWLTSIGLSLFNILPFQPLAIFFSGVFFLLACFISNKIFARVAGAIANLESASITALILTLIVGPLGLSQNLLPLIMIAVIAMASKYVLVVRRRHIFNPAAVAVLISAFVLHQGASWWIGSRPLLPLLIIGGLLIIIKVRRFALISAFVITYLLTVVLSQGVLPPWLMPPALWFFCVVMLIEPLTAPMTTNPQVIYGAFVAGVYFMLPKILPGYPYPLETALVIGNLLAAISSPSTTYTLTLKNKKMVAGNTWSLTFNSKPKPKFIPGQYLEWTHAHQHPDSRGFRRYFTIASSPHESEVLVTFRSFAYSSSFKQNAIALKPGARMSATGPCGDFTLPPDQTLPLCFIAGGIGVTPFRSMSSHLVNKQEKRDIILLYANKTSDQIAFKQLFDSAKKVNVKTVYINTQDQGLIDEEKIRALVPDYKSRIFYISGPPTMVDAFKKMLKNIGVKKIKTDFFLGY